MRRDQQIRINELLLEREELFLRIHALERTATELLGEPYPFTRPPLPSDQKTKRKATPARAASAPRERLRRLEDTESAYRVTYAQFGITVEEEHSEPGALNTLLASQSAELRVLRIETVDPKGQTREILFTAPPAGAS